MLPPQYAINLKLSALSLPLYQLRGKGKLKKSKEGIAGKGRSV